MACAEQAKIDKAFEVPKSTVPPKTITATPPPTPAGLVNPGPFKYQPKAPIGGVAAKNPVVLKKLKEENGWSDEKIAAYEQDNLFIGQFSERYNKQKDLHTSKQTKFLQELEAQKKATTGVQPTNTFGKVKPPSLDDLAAQFKAKAAEKAKPPVDAGPKPHPTLGPGYQIDAAGQVYKGYKFKAHGKEGVSWKPVNPDGSVLAANKKTPKPKAPKPPVPNTPAVTGKATPSGVPDVVLKNEYQKTKAAQYGWKQLELQAWVKSGKTMEEYHYELQYGKSASTPPKPKPKAYKPSPKPLKTAKPDAPADQFVPRGHTWASDHWNDNSIYSSTEISAVKSYTGSGYSDMNSKLRNSQGTSGGSAGVNAAMKRAPRVPANVQVARGVRSLRQFGIDDSGDMTQVVGQSFTEHGYMSTAVEGSGFGGNILKINVPAGHRAIYVSSKHGALSVYGEAEKELLLDRGTQFVVKSARKVPYGYGGDRWEIEVDVTGYNIPETKRLPPKPRKPPRPKAPSVYASAAEKEQYKQALQTWATKVGEWEGKMWEWKQENPGG